MRSPGPSSTHELAIIKVRRGAKVTLDPDDRVFYMGSKDDLSLGGVLHEFAIFRTTSRGSDHA